jgi:hypothetical protein
MLPDLLLGTLFHLFAHGRTQTDAVGSFECHVNPHDGSAFGIGGQLYVPRRVEASVGHLHTPGFGVGRAPPWLPLAYLLSVLAVAGPALGFSLLLLQRRQLGHGPAPGAPASAAPPCCGPPSAAHSTPTTRRHRPAGATVGHAPGPAPATPAHALHAGSGSLPSCLWLYTAYYLQKNHRQNIQIKKSQPSEQSEGPEALHPPIPLEPFNNKSKQHSETFTQNALPGNLSPTQSAIGYYQSDQSTHSSIESTTHGNA